MTDNHSTTDESLLGDFEGEVVHVVIIDAKGKMGLLRSVHEGESLTLVMTGEVGPASFVRKNGLLHRVHKLTADVVIEAKDHLADEASVFLAEERRRMQAERDTGNPGQMSTDSYDDDGEPIDPGDDDL